MYVPVNSLNMHVANRRYRQKPVSVIFCICTSIIVKLPIRVGKDTTAGPGLADSAAMGPRRLVGVHGFCLTPIGPSMQG